VGTAFEDVMSVYENSWKRVLRAINTAGAYGIGVLVDLHGAPGSQNGESSRNLSRVCSSDHYNEGQPHSGISDGKITLFGSEANINKTINALAFITRQLVNVNNVVGIQLLNEPRSVDTLPDFCTFLGISSQKHDIDYMSQIHEP
jgi:aryl-phospho-beta-D-glucosidase BglC (GH1 family)